MLENLQVRPSILASDCIRLIQLTILTGKMQKKRFCAKLKNNITLSVFDYSVRLVLKGLIQEEYVKLNRFLWKWVKKLRNWILEIDKFL